MAAGDFVWCDLSALNPERAKDFYGRLFGWRVGEITQPDGTPYYIASVGPGECAGLFEMPAKFQALNLPSFWMSYIAVDDIARVVDRARQGGGKVEVEPQSFSDDDAIALIRDPLGAGFTVYQGGALSPRMESPPPGHMAWNALFVSDAQAVMPFYADIFGWQMSRGESNSCAIRNSRGDEIAAIYEQPDELRGGYQYWGVHFAVRDIAAAKVRVCELGGNVLVQQETDFGPVVAAQDPDGASFYVVQLSSR